MGASHRGLPHPDPYSLVCKAKDTSPHRLQPGKAQAKVSLPQSDPIQPSLEPSYLESKGFWTQPGEITGLPLHLQLTLFVLDFHIVPAGPSWPGPASTVLGQGLFTPMWGSACLELQSFLVDAISWVLSKVASC